MPAAVQPILDHIVLLVPHATLLHLPSWLSDAFTVLQGGRHADGATENKLLLFRDGVYLELIAFLPGHDAARSAHRWGRRREGHVIDWANTLPHGGDGDGGADALAAVRARVAAAGSGVRYSEPAAGGRVRPDGTELRWTVSVPCGVAGGAAPFWCLDHTPRHLRVPHAVDGHATHASGAVGVAGVIVAVRDVQLRKALKDTYDALYGREGEKRLLGGAEGGPTAYAWALVVPDAANGNTVPRTLKLTHEASPQTPDVHVRIDLVASSEGSVSGHLGDPDWLVEFRFVSRS